MLFFLVQPKFKFADYRDEEFRISSGEVLAGRNGFFGLLLGGRSACFHAVKRNVSILGLAGVVPDRFPKNIVGRGGVQNVVDDLKGQAKGLADRLHQGDSLRGMLGEVQSHQEGGRQHGRCLVVVDVIKGFLRNSRVFGKRVDDLPSDQVAAIRCFRQGLYEGYATGGLVTIVEGEETEGLGEQGIASQNGRRLVKLDMGGWFTPPQGTVVHAGKIVMDEGVGMQALDRDRCREGVCFARVKICRRH